MTVMATTATQDLDTRIENLITNAMNRIPATVNLGRALKDAASSVATALQAQVRKQGWEPHDVEALRKFTLATAANMARDLVAAGYMTADEFRAA